MKRKQFSEEQIIKVLAVGEAGATGKEVWRRHGISEQTFLSVEVQVRRNDRVRGQAAEGAGSGGPKAETVAGRSTPGQRGTEGAVIKKLVRPAAKREAVQHLVDRGLRSQRRAANLVGMHRSVARYRSCRETDSTLRERLKELATQYPRYGYETLHGLLKLEGRRFRIFNLVDDFTRECVGQIVDFSISGERVARYLDEVSSKRKLADEIVLDNDPEMTSKALWFLVPKEWRHAELHSTWKVD